MKIKIISNVFVSVILVVLLLPKVAYNQDLQTQRKGFLLGAEAGYFLPQSALKDRFGNGFCFGGNVSYKSLKGYFLGIQGTYFSTGKVKENPLAIFYTDGGYMIDRYGNPAVFNLEMRSFYTGLFVGKLIKLNQKSEHEQGLFTSFGLGFFQHRINIVDNDKTILQIRDDKKYGYDRLSNGVGLQQFLGYMFLQRKGMLNLYAGLFANEAIAKNRRDWNYGVTTDETKSRTDIIIGLKSGIIISLYRKKSDGIYY